MNQTLPQPTKPVKRRRTTDDYVPKEAPGLTVEYQFSPGCKESGEWRYSLGSPAEPASVEIIAVTDGDGQDLTEFLNAYAFDFDALQNDILSAHGDAEQDARDEAADRKADEQREERA